MPALLSWLRRIYSLDTLDTRFTSTATTPGVTAADTRPPAAKDARAKAIAQGRPAPLWRTPEFFIYYLFFITLVPLMFKTVVDASKGRFPAAQATRCFRAAGHILIAGLAIKQTHILSIPHTPTFFHRAGSPVVLL